MKTFLNLEEMADPALVARWKPLEERCLAAEDRLRRNETEAALILRNVRVGLASLSAVAAALVPVVGQEPTKENVRASAGIRSSIDAIREEVERLEYLSFLALPLPPRKE